MSENPASTGIPNDLTVWVDTDLPGTQGKWEQTETGMVLRLETITRDYLICSERRDNIFFYDLVVRRARQAEKKGDLYRGPLEWECWHLALAAIVRDLMR